MSKDTFQAMFAVICTTIISALGGWDMGLQVLVFFVVVDYITGIIAAATKRELSSEIGAKGIAKKVCIFALVAIGHMIDQYTGQHLVREFTVLFYMANEGFSILENIKVTGLPLPPILIRSLELLKKQSEKN